MREAGLRPWHPGSLAYNVVPTVLDSSIYASLRTAMTEEMDRSTLFENNL
jgi:hypothetical protein